MSENEMDYRGSKSSETIETITNNYLIVKGVKEQRVDGNWCFNLSNSLPRRAMLKHLRYTLMGLERGYQVEVPSKRLKINNSTSSLPLWEASQEKVTLNPYFITGFTDAEGSFTVSIYPDERMSTGIRVNAEFKIGLNERDLDLLLKIQKFFGDTGKIHHDASMNA